MTSLARRAIHGILIIGQSAHDGGGILRIEGLVLEQPDEGAGQPAIADRVERLHRLGPDLGVVGAERAADDAAGFGRAEDDERAEGQVDDAPLASGDGVDEERITCTLVGRVRRREWRPAPATPGSCRAGRRRPPVRVAPGSRRSASSRTSGPCPRSATSGGLLGAQGSRRRAPQQAGRRVVERRPGQRPPLADVAGLVVERGDQVRCRGIVGRSRPRAHSRRPCRTCGGRADKARADGIERHRFAEAPDGPQPGDARRLVRAVEQAVTIAVDRSIRPARAQEASHGRADVRARVLHELVDDGDVRDRVEVVGRDRPERPDGGRPHGFVGIAQSRHAARPPHRGGPPSAARASRAATRTDGAASSSTAADQQAAGPLRRGPAKQARPSSREVGSGASSAATRACVQAGSCVRAARPGAALEDLLAEPGPKRPYEAAAYTGAGCRCRRLWRPERSRVPSRNIWSSDSQRPPASSRSPAMIPPTWFGTPSLNARTCARRSAGMTL